MAEVEKIFGLVLGAFTDDVGDVVEAVARCVSSILRFCSSIWES